MIDSGRLMASKANREGLSPCTLAPEPSPRSFYKRAASRFFDNLKSCCLVRDVGEVRREARLGVIWCEIVAKSGVRLVKTMGCVAQLCLDMALL